MRRHSRQRVDVGQGEPRAGAVSPENVGLAAVVHIEIEPCARIVSMQTLGEDRIAAGEDAGLGGHAPGERVVFQEVQQVELVIDAALVVKTLGREGSGPGEFTLAFDMVFMPDGSLGVAQLVPGKLVQIAHRARNLKGHGLDEGMSTRLLIYAAQLISKGIEIKAACDMALVRPLTDDPDMRDTLDAAVNTYF